MFYAGAHVCKSKFYDRVGENLMDHVPFWRKCDCLVLGNDLNGKVSYFELDCPKKVIWVCF